MNRPPGAASRWFRLVGREPAVQEDIETEIAFHLDAMAEFLEAQGYAREDAHTEALRRFGRLEQVRRELRRIDTDARRKDRRMHWFTDLGLDIRYALRALRRAPGFAATIVGTLGLAIGANTTMVGLVDRVLLSPPPHLTEPDQVRKVLVARYFTNAHRPGSASMSYPGFTFLQGTPSVFTSVATFDVQTLSLGLGAEAQPIRAILASSDYFTLLGVRPSRGRFFTEEENREPLGAPVAVISDAFWQQQFDGEPTVLGRTILVAGQSLEIIGVAPPGFTGSDRAPVDVWVPLMSLMPAIQRTDDWRTNRGWQFLETLVRLEPGVTLAQAEDRATQAWQQGHADWGEFEQRALVRLGRYDAVREGAQTQGRVALWLLGVSVLVLVIACANVANLMMARGLERRGEVSVRLALGVARPRLVRQLLVESLLLGVTGGIVGIVLAIWGSTLVQAVLIPETAAGSPLSPRLLVSTAAVTVLVTLLAGLAPLLHGTKVDLASALQGAARTIGGGAIRVRASLLLVQTTLCTALLVGAGLFVRSLNRAIHLDLGFEPAGAILISPNLGTLRMSLEERLAFFRAAEERVRRLPGVAFAGSTVGAPFRNNLAESIRVPGVDSIPRLAGGGPYYFRVTPGLLEALQVRLVRGRLFQDTDRRGTQPVLIVTERMAETLWPGVDPIGKCVQSGGADQPCSEVVGVIRNLHRQGLEEDPFLLYFVVLDQAYEPATPEALVIRTSVDPETLFEPIRRELMAVRSDLPYVPIRTYEEHIAPQARSWRLGATLFTIFGALSLLIASVGLYGVLSFLVAQRSRELGVRAALGATPGRLMRGVLKDGLMAAVAGIVLGLGVVVAVGGRLQDLLFQTSPRDPLILSGVAVLVLVIAIVASLVPGLRATRADPLRALRAD